MKKESCNTISKMQFKGYDVNKLFFEQVKGFGGSKYNVNPQFFKKILKLAENQYDITLGCRVISTEEEPFSFNIEVVLTGHFIVDNMSEEENYLINENAVAILFPYIRSTLSMLTLNANKNSLVLPTLNIVNLFKENKTDNKESEDVVEVTK